MCDVEHDILRLAYDVVGCTYDIVRRRTMSYLTRIQMASPARGGFWSGRPAVAAGTAGPRRLPARQARGGCWHGLPAAAARKWIRKCLNSDLS